MWTGRRPGEHHRHRDREDNGYTDWFLPSQDEVDLMYHNPHQQGLGGFAADRRRREARSISLGSVVVGKSRLKVSLCMR